MRAQTEKFVAAMRRLLLLWEQPKFGNIVREAFVNLEEEIYLGH